MICVFTILILFQYATYLIFLTFPDWQEEMQAVM